jgi:hypothetical protein
MGDRDINFRNPKRVRLNIVCVYLSNYFKADDQGEVAKAKTVLDTHNLQLEVWPEGGKKYAGNTIIYPDPVPEDPYDDEVKRAAYKALRAQAQDLVKSKVTFATYMLVIFGQFKEPGIGVTPAALTLGVSRGCMISPNGNTDKMDLLHEMGHGADLHHEEAVRKNFMNPTDGRSEMMKFQVEKMAKAWYAVG